MYVFDNSPISILFRNFYRGRFPSLWERFDELIDGGNIVSTREVRRELEDFNIAGLEDWLAHHRETFAMPTAQEGEFVSQIFAHAHFQQNIEQQKLLRGGKNADPFVVAKAAVEGRVVVTVEAYKPNAAKIPNICEHFGVQCLDLEGFMEAEGWQF